MKYRSIKLAACLLASALIVTAGIVPAQATEVNQTSISSDKTTGVVSGVSSILTQISEQTAPQELISQETQVAAVADKTEEEEDDSYSNIGVAQVNDYVNVRSEASTDSEIVGVMKNNTVATVDEEQDGWYKITSGSISGYIKSDYLTVGNRELIDSVKTRVAEVQTETLRVRSEASVEASVITQVGMEEKLTVLDEQTEGWVQVKTSDGEGFVSAEYVSVYDTYQYAEKPEEVTGGSAVSSFALQFVGNPYVWGGTSLTNGADCSGFIMSVYAHFGISLPHSSSALRSVGRGVSYSEAQPGDIICYSGHVALYIGNGQIVHASNKRDGIKVSPATYTTILAVRRVMN
jgi:cell wall-associated NlpC family hydrolase